MLNKIKKPTLVCNHPEDWTSRTRTGFAQPARLEWLHLEVFLLPWEVIAYAVADALALLAITLWYKKLCLSDHSLDRLKNMKIDMTTAEMVKMLKNQTRNIVVDKQNMKGTRASPPALDRRTRVRNIEGAGESHNPRGPHVYCLHRRTTC
jgi:hypothetical protein